MFRCVAFLALPALLAAELGSKDIPIIPGQPWHVHDPDRPHPPMVAPGAPPREWNVHDIVFEAPRFEGDKANEKKRDERGLDELLRTHKSHGDEPLLLQDRGLPQRLAPLPRPVRSARKVI